MSAIDHQSGRIVSEKLRTYEGQTSACWGYDLLISLDQTFICDGGATDDHDQIMF